MIRHMALTLTLTCCGLPATAAPVAAPADLWDGRRDGPTLEEMVADFTRCVVRKHHAEAKAYILSDPPRNDLMNDPALYDRDCFHSFDSSGGVTFIVDMYRSALATALVQADFATDGPADFTDRAGLAHPPAPIWPDAAKELGAGASEKARAQRRYRVTREAERADLARIGECMVRAQPAAARLWILTRPGSAEDTSGARPILSAFESCSKPAAIVHYFNAELVRGAVSIGYYRLAYAPQLGTGAVAK